MLQFEVPNRICKRAENIKARITEKNRNLGGTKHGPDSAQKKIVVAAFLGWTLDAFDFFLLVFLLGDIAKEFGVNVPDVSYALFLTLAMRFIGAFIFGRLADHFGRKPILMLNIICYSVIGALAAFSPSLWIFLTLRALFGVAMGGEWGLGSSLAMESIPPRARGVVSGILQCGYPVGYLLAAIVYGLLYQRISAALRSLGARCSCSASSPRLSSCSSVRMSPNPRLRRAQGNPRPKLIETLRAHWGVALYSVVLMMCFNLFSHGTQDLYPTFLQKQHGLDYHDRELDHDRRQSRRDRRRSVFRLLVGEDRPHQRHHHRRAHRASALPLWAYSSTPFMLAVGAFVMQIAVQGAWGVIPAHLNEISPGAVRATLPGFVYQAGNFLASYNGPFQAKLAESTGGNYAYALALVAGIVAVVIIVVIRFSPERRGEIMTVIDVPGEEAPWLSARNVSRLHRIFAASFLIE